MGEPSPYCVPVAPGRPSDEDIKATCQRFAWRYHARCKGRGWLVVDGKVIGCTCAGKRMRRHLKSEGAL